LAKAHRNPIRKEAIMSRFRFLVVALLVIGAAASGALAQPGGDTGGGTIYFMNYATTTIPTNWMWSIDADGSNMTCLGCFAFFYAPSRELHNGYRWYLTIGTICDSFYPDGTTQRIEVFALREDYNCHNPDTAVRLTNNPTLQPTNGGFGAIQWLPGDQKISFKARRWEGNMPVEGGLYTADLVFRQDGNISGLVASPTTPTLAFPLDSYGWPTLDQHSWDPTCTKVVYQENGLWVADLSKGTRTHIYSGCATDPDWSPDGGRIVMGNGTGGTIYTIRPNGKGLTRVISPRYIGTDYWTFSRPCFSRTGSHIVCTGKKSIDGHLQYDLFRADNKGRYLTQLTESSDWVERAIAWR
jgi:hypothetical protein